jgi:sulfide:quinone oxidoreductase
MKYRVLVLGAGFGGLELTTILSETLGNQADITLIDKNDSFTFGYSKLDVMFGKQLPESVRLPYRSIAKPGVTFRQETITEIDPVAKTVTTNAGVYEADILVIALGADYDLSATPGLIESGHEFYSVEGAFKLREVLANYEGGDVVIGVDSWPYKCPPAPCETALMLHDFLSERGIRDNCTISLVMPMSKPIPPSPPSSEAILEGFREQGISYYPLTCVKQLDFSRGVAVLDDDKELPCNLFLGVPKHCLPEVLKSSSLAENGWIPVSPINLMTKFPGVYSVGDVTSVGIPKAGIFAEAAAKVAAAAIIAEVQGGDPPPPFTGAGTCYIEFGGGRIGKIDVDFLSGETVQSHYHGASTDLLVEKKLFGSSRKSRWFGL